jgi:hypothetical protein
MIPNDFDWKYYLYLHDDLTNAGLSTEQDAINHYTKYGYIEERCYKKIELPKDFDYRNYLLLNTDLLIFDLSTEYLLSKHYLSNGFREKRSYLKIEHHKIDDVIVETPIYLFYHIWAKNDWYDIFQEQIEQIKSSGLWENLNKIFINICGLEEDKLKIVNYLKSKKVIINIVENNFEFPTLIQMSEISQNEKFKGVYIHAKSTSYSPNHKDKWKYEICRKILDYQILKNWKSCYTKILSHDLVGTLFRIGNTEIDDYWQNWSDVNDGKFRFTDHFSGNFYWFDSEYFSKIPKLNNQQKENRFNAEWYPFTNHPIYFNIFNDFDLWIEELEKVY